MVAAGFTVKTKSPSIPLLRKGGIKEAEVFSPLF